MKAKLITYWIATILICGQMAFVAFAYLTQQSKMMEAFASLGYPDYFPFILGTAKLLGVIALLVPGFPLVKEWAYAGFTFTFIGAAWSHFAADQNAAMLLPIASLVVLSISCLLRPATRRVASPRINIESHGPADVGLHSGTPRAT